MSKIMTISTLSFLYNAGHLLYLKLVVGKRKRRLHDRKTGHFRANKILVGIEDAYINNGNLVWFLFSVASMTFLRV